MPKPAGEAWDCHSETCLGSPCRLQQCSHTSVQCDAHSQRFGRWAPTFARCCETPHAPNLGKALRVSCGGQMLTLGLSMALANSCCNKEEIWLPLSASATRPQILVLCWPMPSNSSSLRNPLLYFTRTPWERRRRRNWREAPRSLRDYPKVTPRSIC